jgi:hypothetical protein
MTLLNKDHHAPSIMSGNLPVTSRYTYGLAGERFFRHLKEKGSFLGTYCPECDHTYVPAAIFCERCLGSLDQWVDVGTVGEVHTFTLLYENYDGTPKDEPEVVAFIKFGDGGIVHRLGEIQPEDVTIGMKVGAVIVPPPERQGSILDISHFRPVDQ